MYVPIASVTSKRYAVKPKVSPHGLHACESTSAAEDESIPVRELHLRARCLLNADSRREAVIVLTASLSFVSVVAG